MLETGAGTLPLPSNYEVTEYPVVKAGCFIVGDVATPAGTERYVMAPYSEGRFGHERRHFSLPKGSIDPGETPFLAAIRESKEETGINLEELIGARNLDMLQHPEKFTTKLQFPFPSPKFHGVLIKRITLQPVADQMCLGNNGSDVLRTQMFAVELAEGDILKLKQGAKNHLEVDGNHKVLSPVRKVLSRAAIFPKREQLIEWMREGRMPEYPWNKDAIAELAVPKEQREYYKDFTEEDMVLGDENHAAWFSSLEEKTMRRLLDNGTIQRGADIPDAQRNTPHALGRKEWKSFFQALPAADQKKITDMAKKIKRVVGKLVDGMGSDADVFKIDTADIPLNVYQEGATIMPLREYLHHGLAEGTNSDYRRVFLGSADAQDPLAHGLLYSQFGTLLSVARDSDIEACRSYGSPVIGTMQALRLKFAEQQKLQPAGVFEAEAGIALERAQSRTLATINDEAVRGRSFVRRMQDAKRHLENGMSALS